MCRLCELFFGRKASLMVNVLNVHCNKKACVISQHIFCDFSQSVKLNITDIRIYIVLYVIFYVCTKIFI